MHSRMPILGIDGYELNGKNKKKVILIIIVKMKIV